MNSTVKAIAVIMVLALALATAAAVQATEAEPEGKAEEAPLMSREEVLKTLPCFKCHSLEDFMAQPEAGKFSHEMHTSMSGLHCSQCHEIKGHQKPNLKGAACSGCHSTDKMTYGGGGMGKVSFGHAAHGSMFACGQCHPDNFKMKKGGVKMTMNAMYKGQICGACHNGKTAFSSQDCMRCHRG